MTPNEKGVFVLGWASGMAFVLLNGDEPPWILWTTAAVVAAWAAWRLWGPQ